MSGACSFVVKTWDVDGSNSRRYRTRKAAIKRFEEMAGVPIKAAIDEAFYSRAEADRPTADTVMHVAAVSMYGTRVAFAVRESEE